MDTREGRGFVANLDLKDGCRWNQIHGPAVLGAPGTKGRSRWGSTQWSALHVTALPDFDMEVIKDEKGMKAVRLLGYSGT